MFGAPTATLAAKALNPYCARTLNQSANLASLGYPTSVPAEFPRRTLLGSSLNKRRALPHTPLQGVGDALGGHLVNKCLLASAYGGYRRCGRRNGSFRECPY